MAGAAAWARAPASDAVRRVASEDVTQLGEQLQREPIPEGLGDEAYADWQRALDAYENAKAALAMSDYGLVLELGQTRMHDKASTLLADPRVGQLFLGGHMEEEEHA